MNRTTCLFAFVVLVALSVLAAPAPAADVERWGMWETSLRGPQSGNPYVDVQLSAVFTQGDRKITVPGF